MNVFRFFQPAASAPMARERLQILLEYERKLGSQINLFAVLREEILAVVSRHASVDPRTSRSRWIVVPSSRRSLSISSYPTLVARRRSKACRQRATLVVIAMRQMEDARSGRNFGDGARGSHSERSVVRHVNLSPGDDRTSRRQAAATGSARPVASSSNGWPGASVMSRKSCCTVRAHSAGHSSRMHTAGVKPRPKPHRSGAPEYVFYNVGKPLRDGLRTGRVCKVFDYHQAGDLTVQVCCQERTVVAERHASIGLPVRT
jgi:Septum formation topological specificity factor MinE